MSDSIRSSVTVAVPAELAFAQFARRLAAWWPREYTWSREVLEEIGIEPREGGHCYELGPHGFRCDWGRVLAWEPPHRLLLLWQLGADRSPEPNPARASEVEVRFVATGAHGTRVEVEHSGFTRHGPGGEAYRAGMASPEGWTYLLERYACSLQSGGSPGLELEHRPLEVDGDPE